MENIFGDINQLIQNSPLLAPFVVLLGGMLTASNPCVLAMVPLMIAFVAGNEQIKDVRKALAFSLSYISGLSITFVLLGVLAALVGIFIGDVGAKGKYFVLIICLLMGFHLLGIYHFNFNLPFQVSPKRRGLIGAFLLGILFGFVSTPCAAPILVVLLSYICAFGGSVSYGAMLLFIYALGHSVLILIAGVSMGAVKAILESKGLQMGLTWLRRFAGALIILIGFYLFLNA